MGGRGFVFISHIGVISSRNGVVVQDLLQNLKPLGIRVDFVHSGVEGADSAPELLRAVEYFSGTKKQPQVLVVIRGGGSLESLQGFNNEAVVRALHAAPLPVLVGIGHDVDAPIATMVADWSASTPTAVAHVINASWDPLMEHMPRLATRIAHQYARGLLRAGHRSDVALRTMRHALASVVARFRAFEQVLRRAWVRLPARLQACEARAGALETDMRRQLARKLATHAAAVGSLERMLFVSDPTRVLARGYALVYGPEGRLVRHVDDVAEGDMLKTRLSDGTISSTVTEKEH